MKQIRTLSSLRQAGKIILSLAIFLLLTSIALAQSGGGYDLFWWTVDGGGGASSGGGYTLVGTSGQADAGVLLSGGNYALAGGFWGAGGLAQSPEGNPIYLPIIVKTFTPSIVPPDLTVTNFTATPLGGRSYRFDVTAKNNGTAVASGNNFHVVVYDMADLNTPLFFWGVQGSSFGAGQSVALTQDFTFPDSVTTDLRAWVDPFNVVVESDDANNTRDLPITVTGLGDDSSPPSGLSLPSGPLPTPTVIPN